MIMINHLHVLTPNHLYIFCLQMSTSCNAIEDLLKTLDRLQKNLDTLLGATSEACPEIEVPPSQQQDSFTQQPNQDTSNKDVVCSKCQHKHTTANCTSAYTTSGIFIHWGGETTTQTLLDKEECLP